MTFRPVLPLLLAVLFAGCNRAPETNQAVREGIYDHLNKNTGLDLKSMDVDLKNVKFEGNRATAMVEFRPKASPSAGMSMSYILERSGKKWVVQKAEAGGHGSAAPAAPSSDQLPPGHPPVSK